MSTKTYQFSGDCDFTPEQKDCTVEGYFFITEKGDQHSPAPEFRLLNVFFKIRNRSGQFIHKAQFFVQIFLDGDLSTIGEVMNQRPNPYTDPFFIRLKEIVMEEITPTKI